MNESYKNESQTTVFKLKFRLFQSDSFKINAYSTHYKRINIFLIKNEVEEILTAESR